MRILRVASVLPLAGALGRAAHVQSAKRVAIIGAGAGGASAAYHLAQDAAEASIPTNITVFERNSYVGGRTTTVNAWDDPAWPIELGGSIFVEVNHIMMNAAKRFHLAAQEHDLATRLALPELGIWNGEKFVITTRAEDTWWDTAKLLWRYGAAPYWTNRLMKSVVGKFLTMYEEPIFPWKSLSDVVEQVGLLDTTGVTGEQYLKANGIGDAFAKEVIQASTRVNYASNLPYIHGLETMVCMATNGARAIAGGNWQIFSRMLNHSKARLHLNTTIARISKQQDNTYELTTSDGHVATFDEVILAAPLQHSDLTLDPQPRKVPDEIPYTKLYVTLFATPHMLDPPAFNLRQGEPVPQYVLTTLPPNEEVVDDVGSPGYYSISIVDQGPNKHASPMRVEGVYKIFSPKPVTKKLLSHILGHDVPEHEAKHGDVNGTVSWIHHKVWYSYPKEYPRVTFEEIELDDHLWYTSGIESFISTMETSALSGKNVARLIKDQWVAEKSTEKFDVSKGSQEGEPQLRQQEL